MSDFVKFVIRVIFFEKSLQKLRFAEMELIEWIILSFFVKLAMDIEAVSGPVSKIDN